MIKPKVAATITITVFENLAYLKLLTKETESDRLSELANHIRSILDTATVQLGEAKSDGFLTWKLANFADVVEVFGCFEIHCPKLFPEQREPKTP